MAEVALNSGYLCLHLQSVRIVSVAGGLEWQSLPDITQVPRLAATAWKATWSNHSQEAHGGRGGAQEGGSCSGKAESRQGREEPLLERVCEGGDWNKVCGRAWQGMPTPTLQDSPGVRTGKNALRREFW